MHAPDEYERMLLAAITDAMDDDNGRQVYADWLEESGRTVEARRVRDQLELGSDPIFDMAMWVRAHEGLLDELGAWRAALPEDLVPSAGVHFKRGLPINLSVRSDHVGEATADRWQAWFERLAALAPTVESVEGLVTAAMLEGLAAVAAPRALYVERPALASLSALRAERLASLSVHPGGRDECAAVEAFLAECPALEELKLGYWWWDVAPDARSVIAPPRCETLRTLSLKVHAGSDDVEMLDLSDWAYAAPGLTSLTTDSIAGDRLDAFESWPGLQQLELELHGPADVLALPTFPSLTRLAMRQGAWRDPLFFKAGDLDQLLQRAPALRKLRLGGVRSGTEELALIAARPLDEFALAGGQLEAAGPFPASLRHLGLRWLRGDTTGLANAIGACPDLCELDLRLELAPDVAREILEGPGERLDALALATTHTDEALFDQLRRCAPAHLKLECMTADIDDDLILDARLTEQIVSLESIESLDLQIEGPPSPADLARIAAMPKLGRLVLQLPHDPPIPLELRRALVEAMPPHICFHLVAGGERLQRWRPYIKWPAAAPWDLW